MRHDPRSPDPQDPSEWSRIPPPLQNWQVIDGEAAVVDADATPKPATPRPAAPRPATAIGDQPDDVIGVSLAARTLTVTPGEAAALTVTVTNHGRWAAQFEVTLEGWLDERWCPDLPQRVTLEPGLSAPVTLTIAPPRQADVQAGEIAIAVVARADRFPGHSARLGATLTVERFAALQLGALRPPTAETSWSKPSAWVRLPLTNQGNYPAIVYVQGGDAARACEFTFYPVGRLAGDDPSDGEVGRTQLQIAPGQTVMLPVEIRPRARSWVGLLPRSLPYKLVARMDTEPPLRRAATGHLLSIPLVGPWRLALLAVVAMVAIFGSGLAGLALLVALRTLGSPPPVAAPPAPVAADAPPVVALVIQMEQPMPTRAPAAVDGGNAPAAAPIAVPGPQGAPIVRADQVTAPGQPTPAGQAPLRPLPGQGAAAPVVVTGPDATGPNATGPNATDPGATARANMTYGEMFQTVAARFDLDWRMLAAQAYLESGFDSLALSSQGDMGLMQIRPATWAEWAPTVDVGDPFDSYANVLVGAAYLDYLRTLLGARGHPQPEWMWVAYNWGPDKVLDHLAAGGTWESLDPARRQYADDIRRIAATIPATIPAAIPAP
jgi:membrane-bound lytic murein transglycosylase F